MTLEDVREFVIPVELVDQTLEPLQDAGRRGYEAFVLWGGCFVGDGRFEFLAAYFPEQTTGRGEEGLLVYVDGEALFRVNRAFYERGLVLGGQVAALTDVVLEAMFVQTPQLYEQDVKQRGSVEGLRAYLKREARLGARAADIERWLRQLKPAAAALVAALDEPPHPLSTTENPLIALPELSKPPLSIADVDAPVEGFAASVAAAAKAGDTELLEAIGEYGRRWEMLVELDVPLGRPTEVWVAEDRPLEIEPGGWVGELLDDHRPRVAAPCAVRTSAAVSQDARDVHIAPRNGATGRAVGLELPRGCSPPQG